MSSNSNDLLEDAERFGQEIAEIAAAGMVSAQDETRLAEQGDRAARAIAAKAAHLCAVGWSVQATKLWREAAVNAYSQAMQARLQG